MTFAAHLMLFLFLHFTTTKKQVLPLFLQQYSMVNVIGYLFPLLSPSFSLPGVVKKGGGGYENTVLHDVSQHAAKLLCGMSKVTASFLTLSLMRVSP